MTIGATSGTSPLTAARFSSLDLRARRRYQTKADEVNALKAQIKPESEKRSKLHKHLRQILGIFLPEDTKKMEYVFRPVFESEHGKATPLDLLDGLYYMTHFKLPHTVYHYLNESRLFSNNKETEAVSGALKVLNELGFIALTPWPKGTPKPDDSEEDELQGLRLTPLGSKLVTQMEKLQRNSTLDLEG